MRYLKKAVLITFALCLTSAFAYASGSAIYSPDLATKLFLADESTYSVKTVSGQNTFVLDNQTAAFDVDDNLICGNNERKRVDVSITYFDNGGGHFYLTYDSFSGKKVFTDYEELYSTQQIITRTFTLYDAKFANGLSKSCDFTVSAPKCTRYEPLSVYKVEVKVYDASCPIILSAASKSTGNIFFYGDTRAFEVSFENMLANDKSVNVKYEITDVDNVVVLSACDTFTILANASKSINYPINVQRYGVYHFNVYLTDESGNDIGTYSYDFSICPNANYENYDSHIGVCPHFNWGRECENGTYIIKNAGIDHIREGYNWATFEQQKGVYRETQSMTNYLDAAQKYKIDVLALAAYGNTLYSEQSRDIPNTPEARAAFAEYVYQMLSKNRGRIKVVEVWNEPDIESYNTNGATPADCAYLVKAVYDRIHTDFPEVEIAAFALANAYNQTGRDWLEEALSTDTDGDGEYDLYKYCDGISVHHYIGAIERISTDGESLKEVLGKYGFKDKKLYHTEFGYTEVVSSYGKWVQRGEEKQAAFLAKYAAALRAYNAGDVFYIYDFSNDGFAENQYEQNFGLVENYQHSVPYAAKPAFIAIANLNRVIGNCEFGSVVQNDGNLSVYKFENKFGTKKSYVMFAEQTKVVYNFSAEDGNIVFYDMYGNNIYPESDCGVYEIEVGSEPVYAVVYKEEEKVETYLETGKITVSGKFSNGLEEEYVAAKVYDKDGKIAYLNQFELDDSRELKFSFSANPKEDYDIWLGMKSLSKIYKTNAEGKGIAVISLEKNGTAIDTFGKITEAETFTLCASIFDRGLDDFVVAAAGYKDSSLNSVRIIKKSDMTLISDGKYTLDISSDMFENADTAGFYIVNSIDSIMPLDKGIKLKK